MKIFLKENSALIVSFLTFLILLYLPTGYEQALIYQDRERATAKILACNNENITTVGLISHGDQVCTLQILDGNFKGEVVDGYNMLMGNAESDKIFKSHDKAFVLISYLDVLANENNIEKPTISMVSMVDHYRLGIETILLLLFAFFLVLVAGKVGIRAILSFAITILAIWKILIPLCLDGYNPIVVAFIITSLLTVIIISLVYGFDKMMLSATIGSLTGSFVTMIMALIFTDLFMLDGVLMQGSQSLLYSGYAHIDLKKLFIASIFIGSSGAVMDLAVDITSSIHEVVLKKPTISAKEAIKSGLNVGRNAMGTMTTTLLLAYSGGYITLLMVFMAQGTPVDNILNYKFVASEILDTIVGSLGLVSVAPLTALCAGTLLSKK